MTTPLAPSTQLQNDGRGLHATSSRPSLRSVLASFRACHPTGEELHISLFNAQPGAPACLGTAAKKAGASGWALNEDEIGANTDLISDAILTLRKAQQLAVGRD